MSKREQINWFVWCKYLLYILLFTNVLLFLREEWAAASHVFGDKVPLGNIITAFAATIDTLAWVILLLLFELETYQIPDEKLTPRVSTALRITRALCYTVIVYALYGYLSKVVEFTHYALSAPLDLCREGVGSWAFLLGLDEYQAVTDKNCSLATSVYLNETTRSIATADTLSAARQLAWVDLINAATWVLVVVNLELDVWLLQRNRLNGLIEIISKRSKFILYTILLAAAAYWGIYGDFLDFWDALLWIVAFVFIEQNIVIWEQELEEAV